MSEIRIDCSGKVQWCEMAEDKHRTANTLELADVSDRPKASIGDVAWLTGHWSGPAFGDTAEETWIPPAGDGMAGVFRLIKGGKVAFYEFISLVEDQESLEMRLKHFGPDMKGFEEKDECVRYRLVKLMQNEAYFEGLTFKRPEPNKLQIFLAMTGPDGSMNEVGFEFQRSAG